MNILNQETGEVTTMDLQSAEINELAKALSKAQGVMTSAQKDGLNPHFKAAYATLNSIFQAIRKPLADNGLSVIQTMLPDNTLVTTLMHDSGQWARSYLKLNPSQDTPQGIGSALTYARRYSLAAIVGISQDDDDGEEASQRPSGHSEASLADKKQAPKKKVAKAPAPASNGNGNNIPNNPPALLAFVNARVEAVYDNLYHLENAIRQELGKGWKWPRPNDAAGWEAAYKAAHKHALAKVQAHHSGHSEASPTQETSPGAAELMNLMNETDEGQAEMFDGDNLDDAFPRGGGAAYQD